MTSTSSSKQSHTGRKATASPAAASSATASPAAGNRAAGTKPRLHDEAARNRARQRQRQQMLRRMRPFESLLPSISEQPQIRFPNVAFGPIWRILRSRVLWIALAVVVAISSVAAWVSLDERWYVYREDVHFNGLSYLDAEALWELSAVDGWQVFWIDRVEIRQRLLQNPYVADAEVHISPLTTKITVDVTEVRPVALWTTDAGTRWLRDDGRALEPIGETPPGLMQILDAPADATLPGADNGAVIDPAVLRSAQALANRLPGVAPLRYNSLVGLNFRLPNAAYWVYWGDDDDIEKKLENLAAAETLLNSGQAQGAVIDVRFDRPYIK